VILLRLALRGVRAHAMRLVMTAVSVVLGVSFVVGTLVLTDSMDRAFTEMVEGTNADVDAVVRPADAFSQSYARFGGTTAVLPGDLAPRLADEPEVVRAYPMVRGLGDVLDSSGEAVGIPNAPQFVISWYDRPGSGFRLEGEAPRGEEEFVLDQATAQRAGLERGDTAWVRLDGTEYEMRLTGVFTVAGASGMAGATITGLEHSVAQELVLGDGEAVSAYYLVGQEGKSPWQVADSVAPLLEPGQESVPMDVVRAEESAGLEDVLGYLNVFLLVFAGIALFVAGFLIVNTFAMLLAQRSRELALLRAVGASRTQVRALVMGEALLVAGDDVVENVPARCRRQVDGVIRRDALLDVVQFVERFPVPLVVAHEQLPLTVLGDPHREPVTGGDLFHRKQVLFDLRRF
jgi:putative ABC transport system permease protein